MVRLLLPLLSFALLLPAQQQYPLRDIIIEGAKVFEPERIKAETGLKIGSMVDEDDFQQALGRLGSTGVFETLEYRLAPKDGGYALTITVREVEQVFQVRLLNFDAPEEDLLAALREEIPLFKQQVPATGQMVDRIGDFLQKRWMADGHDSKIMGQLLPIEGEELAMVFQPEQRLQSISFVEFKGSEAVSPLELQRIFNPKAMGEPYTEARLRQLLHYNVRPLFEERGLLGVEFCPCTTRPDESSLGLLVTVEVDDGEVYSYGVVQRPDTPAVSPDKLDDIFDFKSGATVNMTKVTAALGDLDERLRRMGYLKSETLVEKKVDANELTVDLVFDTTLGPQYLFRRLEIDGLDILAEPVVRKRWGLAPGQPFNSSYPQTFLDRVEADGMFERLAKSEAVTKIDETTKSVDVTLVFRGEGPPKQYVPEAQRPKEPF
jgi:outer membrane protein assembly factor BamA